MNWITLGTKRSLGWAGLLLAAIATLSTSSAVTARECHPKGWKVSVRSETVGKHGMHHVTVHVRDEAQRPVHNAAVRLRLHSFAGSGQRLVEARPVGEGRYHARVRLHDSLDDPRSLVACVSEPGLAR